MKIETMENVSRRVWAVLSLLLLFIPGYYSHRAENSDKNVSPPYFQYPEIVPETERLYVQGYWVPVDKNKEGLSTKIRNLPFRNSVDIGTTPLGYFAFDDVDRPEQSRDDSQSDTELNIVKRLREYIGKRLPDKRIRDFVGKRSSEGGQQHPGGDLSEDYTQGNRFMDKRLRDFVGKRSGDEVFSVIEKRIRDFVGKREDKRLRYFVGKKQEQYSSDRTKRLRDFIGKRSSLPLLEYRLHGPPKELNQRSLEDLQTTGEQQITNFSKRIRDFVGKREKSVLRPTPGQNLEKRLRYFVGKRADRPLQSQCVQDSTSKDLTSKTPAPDGPRDATTFDEGEDSTENSAPGQTVHKRLRDYVGKRLDHIAPPNEIEE